MSICKNSFTSADSILISKAMIIYGDSKCPSYSVTPTCSYYGMETAPQAWSQSWQVFNLLNASKSCTMYIILTPVIIRRHYFKKGTFVHWFCMYMYIAQFVSAGSTCNTAGLNLTYLL